MANIKISELTPKGSNLASTDLLEISQSAGGGTYVTKSITGAQIIAAGGLPSWVETNATDLTLWNNGKGNIATNTSFGDGALKSNTSGSLNVAMGYNALDASTTAQRNVAIGSDSLASCTTGSANTIVGYGSGFGITTGGANVLIGQNTSTFMSTASEAVAIGFGAGADSSGISIGTYAGAEQGAIAIGYGAYAATGAIAFGGFDYPAGAVISQVNTSTRYWEVVINGVTRKILLA